MVNFADDVFAVSRKGKVHIRNNKLDSNILIFLYASVRPSARKPSDYIEFKEGLLEIGVPTYFIEVNDKHGIIKSDSRKRSSSQERWEPYHPIHSNVNRSDPHQL